MHTPSPSNFVTVHVNKTMYQTARLTINIIIKRMIFFTDIDECAEGIDNCHPNAFCTNTEGSFICECNQFEGYFDDGENCSRIGNNDY